MWEEVPARWRKFWNQRLLRAVRSRLVKAVEVSQVTKSFGTTEAVRDVSFSVEHGEIFGLLGPNGAGKTTTIRLILDVLRPDHGTVAVLGGPMTEDKLDDIGYMPEERGLYQDLPLERCLVYLATLKGVSAPVAQQRLAPLLERFELDAHRRKKVKELSKGMQQKAQVIHTILHQPKVVVVDEPFSGLDPINTQLVKDLLGELRDRGAAILMSTHQLHRVEELCDRIALIDRGEVVLYGRIDEIRRRFGGDMLTVRAAGPLPSLPGTQVVSSRGEESRLRLLEGMTPSNVLRKLVTDDVAVERFELELPSLDEIFIRVVQEGRA